MNYIREYQIQHGVTTGQAYDITMFIMAGLLIIGFFLQPGHSSPGGTARVQL